MPSRPRFGWTGVALAVLLTGSRPAEAACSAPGDADCVDRLTSFTGTIDFFASGASFAAIDDPADDRPGTLNDIAEVRIPEPRIPQRARLLAAYLYFGGSLFADQDGIDAPDDTVEFQVPGSDSFIPVKGDQIYQTGSIALLPEVMLYSVRADVTELMRQVDGPLFGSYRVRGFDADIFNGAAKHTAANASFSIVLIFEEPRLAPRTVALFDGMQQVLGSTITLDLDGFIVSQVPSGSLTLYAQEGDCNPGPASCAVGNNLSGAERVRVIGQDPSRTITLSGPNNPPNDIFNRTINTVEPVLTNVPGTDIDTFEITDALSAGDNGVQVEITAPNPRDGNSGELIGLSYVVVGIDVFAPELRVDSRVEVRTERGIEQSVYFPGDPLRASYIVSNTGNLPATEVPLLATMPTSVTGFQVVRQPKGAQVAVACNAGEGVPLPDGLPGCIEATGRRGALGIGRVTVQNVGVRHGDGDELVLLLETECPLPDGGQLTLTATIGEAKEGGTAFAITSQSDLQPTLRCGPRFFLFGGGGCSTAAGRPLSSSPPVAVFLAAIGVAFIVYRRRRAGAFLVALLALSVNSGCGSEIEIVGDQPAPPVFGVTCPGLDGMVVVPPVDQRPAFCIDRFEASLNAGGVPGNSDQSAAGDAGDGTTTAAAISRRFVRPTGHMSWYQANAACTNAGRRLCSTDEWLTACRGSEDLTYPYSDEFGPATCNGLSAGRGDVVETGAMFQATTGNDGSTVAGGCVTPHGAYDMSGNLWEWTATSYLGGKRRGLVGGSFRSNAIGMRCVLNENFVLPAESVDSYGFRCCADFPL